MLSPSAVVIYKVTGVRATGEASLRWLINNRIVNIIMATY